MLSLARLGFPSTNPNWPLALSFKQRISQGGNWLAAQAVMTALKPHITASPDRTMTDRGLGDSAFLACLLARLKCCYFLQDNNILLLDHRLAMPLKRTYAFEKLVNSSCLL
jgi:hypothetical protein